MYNILVYTLPILFRASTIAAYSDSIAVDFIDQT